MKGFGLKNTGVDASDLFQFMIVQYRMFKSEGMTAQRILIEQVTIIANKCSERHDHPFPYRINGRIGNLGKQLFEIAAQVLRLITEHSQRNVGTHRPDWFFAIAGHGGYNGIQVFGAVPKGFLVFKYLIMFEVGEHYPGFGKFFQPDLVFVQPFAIRFGRTDRLFELFITDDAALLHIDYKHLSRLKSSLFHYG